MSDDAGPLCWHTAGVADRGSGPAVPSTASFTRAFVGRAHELGVIGSLLQRAVAGQVGALMVSGDAGVGGLPVGTGS